MYAHHFMFAGISFFTPYLGVLPELTLFAITMETSTPALEIMSTLRRVEGANKTVLAATQSVFAALFILTRVLLFGYGLLRSMLFWRVADEELLSALDDRLYGMIALQAVLNANSLMLSECVFVCRYYSQ